MTTLGVNVLAASLAAAILNELISYLFIYRTHEYKRLKEMLMRTEKKLETGVLLFFFYQLLTRTYRGVPVARLPFEPWSWIAGWTHRGLDGDDMREVSVTFVYLICQTSMRTVVTKVFNFGISSRLNEVTEKNSPWAKYLEESEGNAWSESNARELVREGMQAFSRNDVEQSIELFNRAREVSPQLDPYLWQRGLSLYYAGDFADAAAQFRRDVAVNPDDTEEAIWAFLAEAQMYGPEEARRQFLKVGTDRRPVMRAVYSSFQSGLGLDGMALFAANDAKGVRGDKFYSTMYQALYCESVGQAEASLQLMQQAVATPYAQQAGDYMADLARVHLMRRAR